MNWIKRCEHAAKSLTLGKRQQFMNLVWEGKSIGEARQGCDISFEAANGIMRMNIKSIEVLRRESK